jgi:hypothetical protein
LFLALAHALCLLLWIELGVVGFREGRSMSMRKVPFVSDYLGSLIARDVRRQQSRIRLVDLDESTHSVIRTVQP